MAPTPSDTPRLQTRAKNADQHPGLAIPTKRHRIKAEMEEARQKKKADTEAAKKAEKDKAIAAAMLENAIQAKDRQAAAGTADIIQMPRMASKAKKIKSTGKTIHTEAEEASIASLPTNDELTSSEL